MELKTITILCGPTASGKSALALNLARAKNGVIINADSMQIYDALPLLTARPGADDLAAAPHDLYGALDPLASCSAQLWRDLALGAITRAQNAGRHPILVGGTGLYIKALVDGLSAIPAVADAIRADTMKKFDAMGGVSFHAALLARDPVMGARLHPHDTQRLIRAWEVLEATGQSLSYWQGLPLQGPPADWFFNITIMTIDRATLHARCNQRFDAMLAGGALAEVGAIMDTLPDTAAIANALGYRPLRDHLRGLISLDDAVAQAKIDTRQYAKRQDTWFRHQIKPARHLHIQTLTPDI